MPKTNKGSVVDEAQYLRLRKRVEAARAARDRATGQLDGLMDRLRKDFDCDTVEEARRLSKKIERDTKRAADLFHKTMDTFREEWGEYTEDED